MFLFFCDVSVSFIRIVRTDPGNDNCLLFTKQNKKINKWGICLGSEFPYSAAYIFPGLPFPSFKFSFMSLSAVLSFFFFFFFWCYLLSSWCTWKLNVASPGGSSCKLECIMETELQSQNLSAFSFHQPSSPSTFLKIYL